MIWLRVLVIVAWAFTPRDPKAERTVDEAAWSLVHAEAGLARAHAWPRGPYPGGYRRPGVFAYRNLRGLNAEHLDLRGFNFVGADLRSANLSYADLRGADLRDTDLTDGTLLSTRLEDARVNRRTRLPIGIAEAKARGVTWSAD